MNPLKLTLHALLLTLLFSSTNAFAQQRPDVLYEGNYGTLGDATVTTEATVDAGWAPINDDVVYVYDPEFYFFMRGYLSSGQYDRTTEFADYGYVVVGGAGDPGGYYFQTPTWISHVDFNAAYDSNSSSVDLSYSYNTTYVPTYRGFQSFVIYSNLEKVSSGDLVIYDDALAFGDNRYLLTGDGQQEHTEVFFDSAEAASGESAIEVHTFQDAGVGSHYKLMLFANGSAAAFDGVDLTGYDKLSFKAKASQNVLLQGAFGTGDDTGNKGLGGLSVTTEYQTFTLNISELNLSDINTFLWLYLHKAQNPVDFTGLSVYLDDIRLIDE